MKKIRLPALVALFTAVCLSLVTAMAAPAAERPEKDRQAKAARQTKAPAKAPVKTEKRSAARKAKAAPVAEAPPEDGRLDVKSALLMDVNTGEILYEQDADRQIAPASLTKILTLYIVFEAIQRGDLRPWDMIPVTEHAPAAGGSNMALHPGEEVKLTELIKGIAIASANDACVAVAERLEPSIPDFVSRMNQTAAGLGMSSTTFKNPNGMPAEGQLTTARDMLRLAKTYLERFPGALTIHSMKYFSHNEIMRRNANSLLGKYDGVDGLKTGFVNASGFNIVVTAKRGDTRLLAVVLGARSPKVREIQTARLIDEGFKLAEKHGQPAKVVAAAR
ncbi:D-alanyl-D-alanine carboxypeptidase [Desulfovibrio sulfodismutans]|uniref:D-alanyl-D-alanine carboxypeptidase n=1 Tax=Desulfolutivibrio sulfodismutans TaxID=63561 RepID=A0A7K3NJ12_9BACT|nr:D-alanyl-D-alanine carboxypeptidase family protein [Desulfolutivibrio sulfodismutans]NDY55803.1 D-alanyl-D-alanine carboxypeptidase [Desulfolutivibrio sulfodismutans]QLA13419.1 D-alanyl-D-alanine carboxypeptidase [Desulfolutivibrio sulfodismutans DSM 3696]